MFMGGPFSSRYWANLLNAVLHVISASQEAQPQSFPKAQNNNNETVETIVMDVSKSTGSSNNVTITPIDTIITQKRFGNGPDTIWTGYEKH